MWETHVVFSLNGEEDDKNKAKKADKGVSKNSGTQKWLVYNGNPIKMYDLGVPLF